MGITSIFNLIAFTYRIRAVDIRCIERITRRQIFGSEIDRNGECVKEKKKHKVNRTCILYLQQICAIPTLFVRNSYRTRILETIKILRHT